MIKMGLDRREHGRILPESLEIGMEPDSIDDYRDPV
jgi:hypothetical protein